MSVRLYIGMPGYGKTLAMQLAARRWLDAGWLCLTVDRCDEWGANSVDSNGYHRWQNAPPNISEIPQETNDADTLYEELCRLRDADEGWLVRFKFPYDGYRLGEIAREVGNCAVFDDEADYTTSRGNWESIHEPNSKGKCACGAGTNCDLRGFSLNPYRDFVHRGRHLPSPVDATAREVHLHGAMRRPENVHTDVTAEAEEVMLFRSGGHTTTERFWKEGWLTQEQLPDVGELPKLHYYMFKRGEGEAKREVIQLPE